MSSPVLFEVTNHVGLVTLNAEKSLNSLTLEMIDVLNGQLEAWAKDDDVALVVFAGAGERAFCAGADIRALYDSVLDCSYGPNPHAEAFFTREYQMDLLIHRYPKPTVAWGDGVVMGGGLGILGACSHRVGTERSRVALPEITIGLFPDAGASYFFSRMPTHLAKFIGLTGCQLTTADAIDLGLMDYLVPSERRELLFQTLMDRDWSVNTPECLAELFSDLSDSPQAQGELLRRGDQIEQLFVSDDLVEIRERFEQMIENDDWLRTQYANFTSGSPTTAHIVIEQVSRLSNKSIGEFYQMELNIAVQCTRHPDFAEGVRALLVDKDRNPQWRYPTLDAVPREWVEEHFADPFPLGNPLADQ